MRSFLDLVGFEYKKIFKRKSAAAALIILIIFIVISPSLILIGNEYVDGISESGYQAMVKDREYARVLSGRTIDETLMSETKDAYLLRPTKPAQGGQYSTQLIEYSTSYEYQQYARPYKEIYDMMESVYGSNLLPSLHELTPEKMQNFYELRHAEIIKQINKMSIGDKSKEKLIQLDSEVKTPFEFSYMDGYGRFFANLLSTGVFAAFVLSICFAPMFAGEYSTRMDQLILSSKAGKTKLIAAKIFTAFSFTAIFFLLLVLLSFLSSGMIFGFDGGNAQFQLLIPFAVYPLTMLQAVIILAFSAFSGTVLTVLFTLLLSSKLKSPFGVIIIISLLLFIPMMLHVSDSNVWLYNLFKLLPSNMMSAWGAFSYVPYEFLGFPILPYVFIPVFVALSAVIILPLTWKIFKNHQIG